MFHIKCGLWIIIDGDVDIYPGRSYLVYLGYNLEHKLVPWACSSWKISAVTVLAVSNTRTITGATYTSLIAETLRLTDS